MPRKTIEERLAQLEAQKKTLHARLSKQERARDTRAKVLLGAFVLQHLEAGDDGISGTLRDWLRRELPGYLSRDRDRQIFEDLLNPRPSSPDEEPTL